MKPVRIEPLGDRALLVVFGERIVLDLNLRVHACVDVLRAAKLAGVDDIAPAFASLCVRYNPLAWTQANDDRSAFTRLADRIVTLLLPLETDAVTVPSEAIEIPVCYEADFAPDLDAVAAQAKLSAGEVIARHCDGDYRVAMLGFAPGFPYLLGLDPRLHTPRRNEPRLRVPAGAVAIGGAQTGIYPRESPGGWNIIGRTPLALFDVARTPPSLLAPAQRVRFRAIDADQFKALSA